MDSLRARDKVTNDLITSIFKAYLACSDNELVNYIKRKKESYKEGEEVTADNLMLFTDNNYNILKEAGKWKAHSPEEEEIISLHANVEELISNNRYRKPKPGDKGNGKDKGKVKGKYHESSKRKESKKDSILVLRGAKERGVVQRKFVQKKGMVLVWSKYRWTL